MLPLYADPAPQSRHDVTAGGVEQSHATVVAIAGEDDRVWPSEWFVRKLADQACGSEVGLHEVVHPAAGHRVLFPGEAAGTEGMLMARGGSLAADTALGAQAWPHAVNALGLKG